MDNKERYSEYIKNKAQIWKSRFIWRGVSGLDLICSCDIDKFIKDENIDFSQIITPSKYKVSALWRDLDKLSSQYIEYCHKNTPSLYKTYYTQEETDQSLRNHLIGNLGEYFFCFLLNSMKSFDLAYNPGDSAKTEFNFSNVTPRFPDEDDFGVDLVGDVQYKNQSNRCVFQVKFWNPGFANAKVLRPGMVFDYSLAAKTYADAETYVSRDSMKYIFVSWTPKDKNICPWLRRNTIVYPKMSFIGMDTLHTKLDNKVPVFWQELAEELNAIKNF